jgi:hypothetical protein
MPNAHANVIEITEEYVKAVAAVKADNTNTKWFPKHEDDVTRHVRLLHEQLGRCWKDGKVS